MCGIAGVVAREPLGDEWGGRIAAMKCAMFHRGPDGEGEYRNTNVVIAMRRLSIIDLVGGGQPLFNEDRSIALVANGEVYNFLELREQLEKRGHVFSTHSDCETIVHLYEEYGVDCVQHLRGMYAFALWDEKRRRLLLVRDRLGEKPLYLHESEGRVVFASELKTLLASGIPGRELDEEAIDLYFHFQYVPEPQTPLKGVRKLDAGHLLVIDTAPWQVTEKTYWRMEDAPPLEGNPAEIIRQELDIAARLTIRSDVPVGVALSGGLDSAAIAALAARHYPGVLHAFSIGYPGRPPSDERADAKAFADKLGVPFHDIELETGEMTRFFPELVWWRDDPIADISGFGYFSVMKLAREHRVPVVLQGQGGDELFWGYPWVKEAAADAMQRFSGKGPLAMLGRLTTRGRRTRFYDLTHDYRTASEGVRNVYGRRMLDGARRFRPGRIFDAPQKPGQEGIGVTRLIFDTYLRENGITQGDRLSMASSIELRLPLLDYRLVETVIGLRKTRSDFQEPPKAWFKEALGDLLPREILDRPKRGFAPPVGDWHRALFAQYGAQLQDGYLVQAGILSPEGAAALAKGSFPRGVATPLSFKALVLELWCRGMEGKPAPSAS
jgi:asparagine synthase (glutamine-hydrolysing)